MPDFKESYARGKEAAVKADMARKEIAGVFKEVSDQLLDATGGKLEIRRETRRRSMSLKYLAIDPFNQPESYSAVVARNPRSKVKDTLEIAEWSEANTGYPCKLSWSGVDHTCHDKESLEAAFSGMLEDAWVGQRLHSLVNLPLDDKMKPPAGAP